MSLDNISWIDNIMRLQLLKFLTYKDILWVKNLNFNDIGSLINRFHNKGVM